MKILLATDGSPCSDAAVEEVARRQWLPDSQIRVVSVVEPPAPLVAEPYMLSASFYEEAERVKSEQAIEALERAAAKISAGAGGANVSVSTEILLGSPKRVIVEEADEWDADLIVVGSHGYKSWERMLLGSVSQTVAAHAACSVEIVRCKKNEG